MVLKQAQSKKETRARPWPYLAQVGLLFALYVATARLGLGVDAVSGFATAVWPPTGIALAALVLFGPRLWPGIALGALLVNLLAGAPPLTAGGMATGNTLEALAGAALLRRVMGFHPSLTRLRDLLGLVLLAALLSTLVSATIGVTSGWLGGVIPSSQYGKAWWTWWVGDALGDLVVAPLLFTWCARPGIGAARGREVEAGALLISVVIASLIVFADRFTIRVPSSPYMLFPLLIWAALRFGPRGAATATFLVAVIAVWGTAERLGPFIRESRTDSLLALQTFMGIVAVSILVLAADVAERRRAEEALLEAREELERRVQERTAELARVNTELAGEMNERSRAQESLRQSERLLAEAQQIAHLGSWEWDIVTNTVTWTEELYRIYGLKPHEADLDYENFLAHVDPADREFVQATVERSRRDHQPFEYDHRIVRPDGTVRWVHGRGAVVRADTGQPVRMLGTAQDITERKQVEDALRRAHDDLEIRVQERTADLERADRAKDQFLAMLAHELRNPLAAIRNAVHLLKLRGASEPHFTRAREVIERQVGHQTRLLDDLLNVSRIARGKIELHCQRLDLAALVRDTVEDNRGLLEAAGLSLELSLPAEPVWVEADPTRIAQVLGNLLQNSAKFTNREGQVRVRLDLTPQPPSLAGKGELVADIEARSPFPCREGGWGVRSWAVLTVSDTGIGIEPELLPYLFEPFTQADRSLDRSRGGLGLGLALVKGLVELHGGEVRAASEGEGRGAEFTILLPLAPPPVSAEPVSTAGTLPGGPKRVLIVEDNPDTAETLRDLLELLGCTVIIAGSGPEAIELAPRFRPEVVLCDLGLPHMDGYQVAAALRQNGVTADARLIAVSGYGQEEDQQRSREAGFHRHLIKPVDFNELRQFLELAPPRPEGEREVGR